MRILITGTTGQVGHELETLLQQSNPNHQLLTPNRQLLDLTKLNEVEQYLAREQPDLILNAAAYTAVDQAETDRETATLLNTQLPELLATYCQTQSAQLVHYSTDYVYNGTGTQAWQEADSTEPLNHYGQTKLEGDLAIQQNCTNYLILRTSWVYSNRGKNFLNTMLRLGQERDELSIVNDQHGAPTPASYIAQTTLDLLKSEAQPGIYHLAAAGETTWFGFAEAIFSSSLSLRESNRVHSQAISGRHGLLFFTMAFIIVSSFLIQATMTTFAGLPADFKRSAKRLIGWLYLMADNAAM